MDVLLDALGREVRKETMHARVSVPASDGKTISLVEAAGHVINRDVEDENVIYTVRLRRKDVGRLERIAELTILSGDEG